LAISYSLGDLQMGNEPESIMTIKEIAEYLKIPKSTVYKLAQEGSIPAQKVGRHWRFKREVIDRWLENRSEN
jgi:excisionase family DNA binding protein